MMRPPESAMAGDAGEDLPLRRRDRRAGPPSEAGDPATSPGLEARPAPTGDATPASEAPGAPAPAAPTASPLAPSSAGEAHTTPPARLPGAPRSGYRTLTGPLELADPVLIGPAEPGTGEPDWEPTATAPLDAADATRLAPWALFAALSALLASFFVAWALPVAIIAVIVSIVALRRPVESRATARWALVLGITAFFYSAGWLIWAAMRFEGG